MQVKTQKKRKKNSHFHKIKSTNMKFFFSSKQTECGTEFDLGTGTQFVEKSKSRRKNHFRQSISYNYERNSFIYNQTARNMEASHFGQGVEIHFTPFLSVSNRI